MYRDTYVHTDTRMYLTAHADTPWELPQFPSFLLENSGDVFINWTLCPSTETVSSFTIFLTDTGPRKEPPESRGTRGVNRGATLGPGLSHRRQLPEWTPPSDPRAG